MGALNYTYIDGKDVLVTKLTELLRAEGYGTVRVFRGDPRLQTDVPCIGINRAGDDEAQQVIGNSFDTVFDDTLGKWVEIEGTYFSETLEIRVWHTNADERDTLYRLTKVMLFAIRNTLAEHGIRNITLRGGRDEQDNTFNPTPMYWGSILMTYIAPLEVNVQWDKVTSIDVLSTISANFKEGVDVGGEK